MPFSISFKPLNMFLMKYNSKVFNEKFFTEYINAELEMLMSFPESLDVLRVDWGLMGRADVAHDGKESREWHPGKHERPKSKSGE